MTPTEAAKILDIPDNATPEQIEARFHELRTKLEDKIAKAPTPGLKAKYRESLDEITRAFETLALAADSSALPVLRREKGEGSGEKGKIPETGGRRPEAGNSGPSPSSLHPSPAPQRKSGGMEFAIVAVIAVAVLGAGGWWVVKTRAENAEKARIAAEAKAAADAKAAAEKAEAERKAAEERRLAEEKRLAEEAEKARIAAAQKSEEERREKLLVQARTRLAEIRATWEVFTRAERDAERALADAKGDLRGLRDAPAGRVAELNATVRAREKYHQWIADYLLRHPARTQRAQAEEMVSAGAVDEATQLIATLVAVLPEMEAEIRREQQTRLAITGTLRLASEPAGLEWSMEDGFGRKFSGRTPAEIPEVAETATLTLQRAGWTQRVRQVRIEPGRTNTWTERYADQGRPEDWLWQSSTAELESAAKEGWAEAALEMGDRHLTGLAGTMDFEQARRWYEAARSAGHPGLGARLYLLRSRAAVAPHTLAQIREWLWVGVKAGDPLSVLCWLENRRINQEMEPIAPPRVAAAVEEGTRRAAQGDRLMQLTLASYFGSDADPRDEAKSRSLAEAALAAGNKRALRFLAFGALRDGKDTASVAAGLELMRQAVRANDTAAMDTLGEFYANGRYVAKDEQEALRLWRLAAAQGNAGAESSLGYAYFLGLGVPADEPAGVAWWRKAAAAEDPSAMNELGFALQRGRGVPQDQTQAVTWFRRAAALNHPKGYLNLGYAAINGWGLPQNDTEAVAWWRKSAALNDPYALANLAWAAINGRGMPQSEAEALNYWQRAARLGHEPSKTTLRERGLTW